MNPTKTVLVAGLLEASAHGKWDLSVSRARRIAQRFLGEPDALARCLTYADPVGEQATNRAMRKRRPTC